MPELLPSLAAQSVTSGIVDYLDTTFNLTDPWVRDVFQEFLTDPTDGIFKGPYLRLRLPFQPAADGWRDTLGWHPVDAGGFAPYSHQAAAYARLSSLGLNTERPRPLPTLVTTGTGSGKTEAFLHPILDHVLRAKRNGVEGIKALLLYPMNALANDQAKRLAELITSTDALAGVSAGLYTGEDGEKRTMVTEAGLVTDRTVMRNAAPDILLTNYKMLDQLLLRPDDQPLWEQSANSLQYLVLDEFHTYDGAQGTDVAMLLRRLGIALKAYGQSPLPGDEDGSTRPLGRITPVATSATLGDDGDPTVMLDFAETVFGEPFTPDTVVTETRVDLDTWVALSDHVAELDLEPVDGNVLVRALGLLVANQRRIDDADAFTRDVVAAMYGIESPADLPKTAPGDLLRHHPVTRRLVALTRDAVAVSDAAEALFPGLKDPATGATAVEVLTAALSHVRKVEGRSMLAHESHLWVRELSRIDRVASTVPAFSWSDDGVRAGAGETDHAWFPAIWCRACGHSGWAVKISPANASELDVSDDDIRAASLSKQGRVRALMLATHAVETDDDAAEGRIENLRWFDVTRRQFTLRRPDNDADAGPNSTVLPVLMHSGIDAPEHSNKDVCPACSQPDAIRFLGSALTTQLSIALSTIFGDADLDVAEKKALVFTDSVQDAAHRAGFVQSRSHSLAVRSVIHRAIGDGATLDDVAQLALDQAGNDHRQRYRLLPPDLAETEQFQSFWHADNPSPSTLARVQRRLAFDAALEFGLQSQYGRTLEQTSTVAVEVHADPTELLAAVNATLDDTGGHDLLPTPTSDATALRWARGVLERMRRRGAIHHPWLDQAIVEDGRRYRVWGGRPRHEGMPAFPTGRMAPAFPYVGTNPGVKDMIFDPGATPQSWYTQWTVRNLAIPARDAATLVRVLFHQLARHGVIGEHVSQSKLKVYSVAPTRIRLAPINATDLTERRHQLRCDTCRASVPGSITTVTQLAGGPCTSSGCHGALNAVPGEPGNFYRRFFATRDVQRIIAREHTSLLPDEVRIAYEETFKASTDAPNAPNVLVATPTLEMGIDIGDLSTVMLASLPRTVASYLQRVGRSGRLTGSALDLAFVSGRGQHLPRLGDPLSMINGDVRPPATYLDAEEILRRQYFAAVADRVARAAGHEHLRLAEHVLSSIAPGTYLHDVVIAAESDAEQGSGSHLEAFLAAFPTLHDDSRDDLRTWSRAVDDVPMSSPLGQRALAAAQRWRAELEELGHRITAIQGELPELTARAESPASTDDDKRAVKDAEAALRLARGQRQSLREDHWIGVLERVGLLPNYTLHDDTVTLDAGLTWFDPDDDSYRTESVSYGRASALALRDFAPGAVFYAGGHQLRIDTVDLGPSGNDVHDWCLCPACGYALDLTAASVPSTCPRCASTAIADLAQRFQVVELSRVSSSMRRDDAVIDDVKEDRERVTFTQVVAADIDPAGETSRWYVDGYGLGVRHLRNMTLRWLNLGRGDAAGAKRLVAGNEVTTPLFRLCSVCGHVDTGLQRNSRHEHTSWCRLRAADEESTVSIALSRTLVTEGLLIRLPAYIALGSPFVLPSLAAAVRLGLREHIGGNPDHLALEVVVDPDLEHETNADALLVHDVVPGGTGYLADLTDPVTLRSILMGAYDVVVNCQCSDGRLACHECLLPLATPGQESKVSRLEAVRILRDLLNAGTGTDDDPDPDDEWAVTDVPPPVVDLESKLEQKFREVFKARAQTLGATIREIPGDRGTSIELTLGGTHWRLDPQVLMSGSKPDFVLTCSESSVPRMAIFCDGRKYHATAEINRIADDAEKRARLREDGIHVLSLTWEDLQDGSQAPSWFNAAAASIVMKQPGSGLKPEHLDVIAGGPLAYLGHWIQTRDITGLRAVARQLPLFFFAVAPRKGATGRRSSLEQTALSVADGHEPGTGDSPWCHWKHATLDVVVRMVERNGVRRSETVLLVDDRPEHLAGDQPGWAEWLRLSNLFGLEEHTSVITARSLIERAPTETTTAVQAPQMDVVHDTVLVELAGAWLSVSELASDAELELFRALAAAGVPVPDVELEIDGIPAGPSWPADMITVNFDLSVDEQATFTTLGWTIVEPDAEKVSALLAQGGKS